MIFTHKYRASKNRLYENRSFQKIRVMKNQNFLGQTPRQSDNLTKGSTSRLQGLNRKKREIWQKYSKSQLNKNFGQAAPIFGKAAPYFPKTALKT
jgi:hypothetical protein